MTKLRIECEHNSACSRQTIELACRDAIELGSSKQHHNVPWSDEGLHVEKSAIIKVHIDRFLS